MLRELNTMSRTQPYFRRWKASNALPSMKSSCTSHLSTACCLQPLALGPGWLLLAGVTLGPVALLGGGREGAWMLPFPGGCPRGVRVLLSPLGGRPPSPRAGQAAVPAAGHVASARPALSRNVKWLWGRSPKVGVQTPAWSAASGAGPSPAIPAARCCSCSSAELPHGERWGTGRGPTQPGLEGRGGLCGAPQPLPASLGAGTHRGREPHAGKEGKDRKSSPKNFSTLPLLSFHPTAKCLRWASPEKKKKKKILIKSSLPTFWLVTGDLSCESMLTASDTWRLISSLPTSDFCSFPVNSLGKQGFAQGVTLKADTNPGLQGNVHFFFPLIPPKKQQVWRWWGRALGGKVCQEIFCRLQGPSCFGMAALQPCGLSLLCEAGVGVSGGEKAAQRLTWRRPGVPCLPSCFKFWSRGQAATQGC